ncbi:hypothetical protein Tco_1517833 [Tanacetum coccineum]
MVENLYNYRISGAKRWSRRRPMVMTYGRVGYPGATAIDYRKAWHGLPLRHAGRHGIEMPKGMTLDYRKVWHGLLERHGNGLTGSVSKDIALNNRKAWYWTTGKARRSDPMFSNQLSANIAATAV